MSMSRRQLLLGTAAAGTIAGAGWLAYEARHDVGSIGSPDSPDDLMAPSAAAGMRMREFGATGFKVSEVGFGAWAIGGKAYGRVEQHESLAALARAEDLGCNFVDTARVYGDSELVLGQFLRGRRSRWIISSKYSGQPEGMERTIEDQLRRLETDVIDFYMVHWAPGKNELDLYEQLYRIKKAGKARATGISLKTASDIDYVLDHTELDGFMVKCSLLDPDPLLARLHRLRDRKLGVIVRSALKEGFLTGKFRRDVTFPDPDDQRHTWSREQIEETVDRVERFRFLEQDSGSMVVAAARYPLSFAATSTVVLGTKNESQANSNFGQVPGQVLSPESLRQIRDLQVQLGVREPRQRILEKLRRLVGR
jgi:aryl-alcohol dehydrogenase-like predicted oxidoreductase